MTTKKKTLSKLARILRWGKIVAKFAALGTTITGAVTAFTSSSATTGVALSAAGATSYAAAKGIPVQGYEKTKHIRPDSPAGNAIKNTIAEKYAKPAQAAASARNSAASIIGAKVTLSAEETGKPVGKSPIGKSNATVAARNAAAAMIGAAISTVPNAAAKNATAAMMGATLSHAPNGVMTKTTANAAPPAAREPTPPVLPIKYVQQSSAAGGAQFITRKPMQMGNEDEEDTVLTKPKRS